MTKAVVVKCYGDAEYYKPIADGITCRVIPLDEGELEQVKKELELCRAKLAVRAYGDYRRTQRARRERMRIYKAEPMKGAHGAILAVWGALWLGVWAVKDRLKVMRR